jgi:hypothetical protein
MKSGAAESRWLWLILLLAAAVRMGLALQGGQYFFGDESRFMRSVLLYRSLSTGHWELARQALASPEHAGFIFAGALACPLAHLFSWLAGVGDWSQATNVHAAMPFLAASLGLLSVLNVGLIHRVARVHGADAVEARLAALLAAICATLAYPARHLLPYDAALTVFLLAMTLLPRAGQRGVALAVGALGGVCFTVYNGYWFIPPALGLMLVLRVDGTAGRMRTASLSALGCLAAIALVMLPGTLAGGEDYWLEFLLYSGTAYQGLFAEGWSFPWEYLWRSETWLVIVVAVACGWLFVRQRGRLPERAVQWLGLALVIYLLLALTSTGLHRFVVYGRSVRPLLILACLLGGWSLHALLPASPRVRAAAIAGLLGLAALNLAPHFRLSFPNGVKETVWRLHGFPKLALSYQGLIRVESWPKVNRPDLALVNPASIYPVRGLVPLPAGETLAVWRHPHSLEAYLYEGHRPAERRLLRAHPPAMLLIRLAHPDDTPNLPPYDYWLKQEEVPRGY